jgi:hypothetical protein
MSNDYADGASSSLNKTITEIMEYIDDDGQRAPADLRRFMHGKIAEVSKWWALEGFYLGHRESYRALKNDAEVPATLEFEYGEAQLAPGVYESLTLTSRIRRT